MTDLERNERKGEQGIALIITVLLLLMISAIGIAALQHAGDERTVGASSRRKLLTVHAADAAMNVMADRLRTGTPSQPNFTAPMDVPNFMQAPNGLPIAVRSGTTDSGVAMPVLKVGTAAASGGQLNIGSVSQSYGIYRVGIVATDPGGGRAQLQAQFKVAEGPAGY